ncbi:MAG: response regulator [Candidatus Aureabacteria bacterium]|nr:response regulator [Candidatus Auribacterota bacterium]
MKKLQILIVDDEPIIQKLFKDFLTDEYDVYTAIDGEEALKVLGRINIDVVFSDVHMPRMGGVEVLKSVKENYPVLPVIMMDSFPEITSQKMQEMGAFAFIHKPFYLREIKAVLKEVIESNLSESKFSGENRRKDQRFPSLLEVTYKVEGIDGHDEEKSLSKNLSTSGILIESSQYLKKDLIVILKIKIPEDGQKKFITIKGQVKWCMEKRLGERYDTGVQFLEGQETELNQIKNLLSNFYTK